MSSNTPGSRRFPSPWCSVARVRVCVHRAPSVLCRLRTKPYRTEVQVWVSLLEAETDINQVFTNRTPQHKAAHDCNPSHSVNNNATTKPSNCPPRLLPALGSSERRHATPRMIPWRTWALGLGLLKYIDNLYRVGGQHLRPQTRTWHSLLSRALVPDSANCCRSFRYSVVMRDFLRHDLFRREEWVMFEFFRHGLLR